MLRDGLGRVGGGRLRRRASAPAIRPPTPPAPRIACRASDGTAGQAAAGSGPSSGHTTNGTCERDRGALRASAGPRRRRQFPLHDPKETTVKTVVTLLATCGLLLTAVPAMAATPTIRGAVGPGDTIGMSVKPKKGGTYRLTIQDSADEHNFRLRGPGRQRHPHSVGGTGTRTFTVKLRPGQGVQLRLRPALGRDARLVHRPQVAQTPIDAAIGAPPGPGTRRPGTVTARSGRGCGSRGRSCGLG